MQLNLASSSQVTSCTSVQGRKQRDNLDKRQDSPAGPVGQIRLSNHIVSICEKYDFLFVEGNHNSQKGELKAQGEEYAFQCNQCLAGMICTHHVSNDLSILFDFDSFLQDVIDDNEQTSQHSGASASSYAVRAPSIMAAKTRIIQLRGG